MRIWILHSCHIKYIADKFFAIQRENWRNFLAHSDRRFVTVITRVTYLGYCIYICSSFIILALVKFLCLGWLMANRNRTLAFAFRVPDHFRAFEGSCTRSYVIFLLFWHQRMGNKSRAQLLSPKPSVIILRMVSLSMWNHSANILIVERWSSAKAAYNFVMCSGVRLVWARPALGLSSTLSRPLQNFTYYLKTFMAIAKLHILFENIHTR